LGAYCETALTRRNATHCGAPPRVVFGVSPSRVFRRDAGNCTRDVCAPQTYRHDGPFKQFHLLSKTAIHWKPRFNEEMLPNRREVR
jgi:hypothetical protein